MQKTKNLKSVTYLKGKAILVIVFKIWFISTHCAIRYEFCQEGRQTVAAYFLWIIFRERRFRFEFLYLLFRFRFFLWIKMKEKSLNLIVYFRIYWQHRKQSQGCTVFLFWSFSSKITSVKESRGTLKKNLKKPPCSWPACTK